MVGSWKWERNLFGLQKKKIIGEKNREEKKKGVVMVGGRAGTKIEDQNLNVRVRKACWETGEWRGEGMREKKNVKRRKGTTARPLKKCYEPSGKKKSPGGENEKNADGGLKPEAHWKSHASQETQPGRGS